MSSNADWPASGGLSGKALMKEALQAGGISMTDKMDWAAVADEYKRQAGVLQMQGGRILS